MVLGLGEGTSRPVVVQQVIPGSAAAVAGLQAGDQIRSMDGMQIEQPRQISAPRRYAGDAVRLQVVRAGREFAQTLVAAPKPFETSPHGEVLYRAVSVEGARRRVIVTKPRGAGRFPAVLIMGGLGCYSLDGIDRTEGYGRVIDALEQKGYVTMRVEKTGEGDSEGPACSAVAATPGLEAEGYVAGLRALKSYDFVDPSSVFVFAHSLGPVIGSLVVPRESVRGFMAIETVGTSWFEYDLERYRLQHTLAGKPADEVDRSVREYDECSFRFYIGKETPDKMRETPACRTMFAPFEDVPYSYMQTIADISLATQWKQADPPVLVVYGTGSPVTTAHQSQYLADMINSLHPGRASYVEVPGMGHDLARYASMRDYLQRDPGKPHPFHTGLLDVMFAWLDAQRG